MSYFFIFIAFLYSCTLIFLAIAAHYYKDANISNKQYNDITQPHAFSIIINYRNEAANLPAFLSSLDQINYPIKQLTFYFINDNSSDLSLSLIHAFKEQHRDWDIHTMDRVINSNSAKKDGISQAVAMSKHEHIICTDADVVLSPDWILSYHYFYEKHPNTKYIAGPVQIQPSNRIITQLQYIEMIALQMVSIGAFAIQLPFMSNGANMSFTSTAFYDVNGYQGNDHISSGDDVFLLEKMTQRYPDHCHYLKTPKAIVVTHPKDNTKDCIAQRARWAQKGTHTNSILNKWVSLVVLSMNISLLISILFYLFQHPMWYEVVVLWSVKVTTDLVVLYLARHLFTINKSIAYLIPNVFIYPIMVVAIAIKSTQKLRWSNRSINQS